MSAPASPADGMHAPCCSAHGVDMPCARYRRTHFVEVRPCCSDDAARQEQEQRAALGQAEAPGHPFAEILAGTVDTRHRVDDGDIADYLRQKGERG